MPAPAHDVEPLLAGTLALMSAFHAGAPCPHMQRKIAANLERIASHPLLSDEFRTIVGRLAAQWAQREGAPGPHAADTPFASGPGVAHDLGHGLGHARARAHLH